MLKLFRIIMILLPVTLSIILFNNINDPLIIALGTIGSVINLMLFGGLGDNRR